jgi:choline dehydrogenase-like flavoprotein
VSGFDVVVIGSGAGGSPVAQQLASAGAKVLLLERGPRYKREEFDRDEIEWCRRDRFVPRPSDDPHTRRNDEGQRARRTTDGWISTVLGGGTVHMGGYMMRADPADAKQATRLKGEEGHSALDWVVPYDELARFYPQAEKELGVSGGRRDLMRPLVEHPLSKKVEAAAKAAGLPVEPTPRGILSEARADEDRRACTYHDLCASYGCPDDAKSSMVATYIRRAEKSGNLTIWTGARALGLVAGPAGAKAVRVFKKGEGESEVEAKAFVVACGAIESARLLLLSGDGFNPGGNVGKNLWFSLFVEASGFFERSSHGDVQDLMRGSPFLNRTVLLGGNLPKPRAQSAKLDRTGTLQFNFVHDNPIHRAERVATEGGLVWGAELKKRLHRAFTDGRTVIVEGFGESVPHPGSYVDLDPTTRDSLGKQAARITYFHHPRDVRVSRQMAADMKDVLTKMGAADVAVTRPLGETTVLQGGTCRFGASEKDSVIAASGALHTAGNVFVSDGAALPSSTAVPITLTIVANALRTAGHVKKALGA